MIVRHFDIKTPETKPPQDEGWEQMRHGYYVMTKCLSQQKRAQDAERDQAIQAEGQMTDTEFKQDCFLSVLADVGRQQVNMFELGAGWGRVCLELAGVVDYKVIPVIPVSYHCLAVEGEPTHYQWIKEHFEVQNINGTAIHGAVSDKDGTCRFTVSPDPDYCYGQTMVSPLNPHKIPTFGSIYHFFRKKYVKVPMYTVDHLIKKYEFDHLDIIHMDVQGAEYKVMLGAAESIRNNLIDYLLIGTHSGKLNDALKQLLTPNFDLIVDIYPRSVAKIEGSPPVRSHDGCQVYKRNNIS